MACPRTAWLGRTCPRVQTSLCGCVCVGACVWRVCVDAVGEGGEVVYKVTLSPRSLTLNAIISLDRSKVCSSCSVKSSSEALRS